MDEKHALRAVSRGNTDALGWLIDRYTPYVAAIVNGILGPSTGAAEAEETAADVFIALWENAKTVRPEAIRPWLGAVARNKAKNRLRRLRQECPLEEDALTLTVDPFEDSIREQELQQAVRDAVLQMEQPDRDIFLRHYYYLQPVADIAALLQMNESTVKSRLRRGREKLKQQLIQGGFSDEDSDQ